MRSRSWPTSADVELDRESLDRLTHWILYDPSGRDGDRRLVMEFIASVNDGSWSGRWHRVRDVAPQYGSSQYVVELRDGLQLVIVLDYEADPGVMQVPLILS